ncbi:PLD nuclease N-terminal domain-containing protein [Curtobacterium sp. GD1]|uniref:PLD nuclease N-terminal domain-containing protein n=1 Tax=Curtobacterium sp. GD1 TaxID=2810612 RepID=UPI0035B314B6|nr:PLDc_N domain-containing protein [Curtobacterium sp. GD1]
MAMSLVAPFLALAAFISLIRSASSSGWRLLGWTLVVLFVPIIGSATWFLARHRERSVESRTAAPARRKRCHELRRAPTRWRGRSSAAPPGWGESHARCRRDTNGCAPPARGAQPSSGESCRVVCG